MAAPKLTTVSQDTDVMVERKMSWQEATMYAMIREYCCMKGESSTCPARLIMGRAGVVLDCPTCGSVLQTYPATEGVALDRPTMDQKVPCAAQRPTSPGRSDPLPSAA